MKIPARRRQRKIDPAVGQKLLPFREPFLLPVPDALARRRRRKREEYTRAILELAAFRRGIRN